MAFEKITDTSLANKGVTGLPDVPGLTTAEMQAKFDELSRDVIIPKLNEIVDGLNGDEVGLSSQIENPETKEKDVIQNVVNAIYQIVKENSDKRHGHENKETLDKVTAELYDSITALVSMFNGISAVDKTVTADDTKIPTSGAIVNYVTELGAGDMQKAVYDKDNTGIVDDAKKLGGVAPEEYLQKASLPDATVAFEVAETRSNISTGEKVSAVFGKIKKFFADLTAPAFAQMITSKEDLLATKAAGYVPDALAVADAVNDVTGKLSNFENDSDLSLANCTSWGNTDNTITKIGNRVFITFGVQITAEQSSGSLIIGRIAKVYYPKTAYVRANAADSDGGNHMLYIDKSNGIIMLYVSTERYYSASFSYIAD